LKLDLYTDEYHKKAAYS